MVSKIRPTWYLKFDHKYNFAEMPPFSYRRTHIQSNVSYSNFSHPNKSVNRMACDHVRVRRSYLLCTEI